jgi:hypothetical protein
MERSSHGGRGVHGVIEEGNRADPIVENNVELKSLETLLPVARQASSDLYSTSEPTVRLSS